MFVYLSSQDQFLLKTHTMKFKHILPLLLMQAWAAARARHKAPDSFHPLNAEL